MTMDNRYFDFEDEAVNDANHAIHKQQEINIKAAESEISQQERETDGYIKGVEDSMDAIDNIIGGM